MISRFDELKPSMRYADLPGGVTRTYRISRGQGVYYVGCALVWFGLIFGFGIVGIIDDIPPDQVLTRAAAAVVTVLLSSAPIFVLALVPYVVTLRDDQECEFHALLRQRRVRVLQIRSISSDENDIYIRYGRGKIHISPTATSRTSSSGSWS